MISLCIFILTLCLQSATASAESRISATQSDPAGCAYQDEDPGSIKNTLIVLKSENNIAFNFGSCLCCCVTYTYGLYQGTLPFTGYSHIMIACDIATVIYSIPNDGLNHYYLATVLALSLEGSYGKSTAGIERPQGINFCYPQFIGC